MDEKEKAAVSTALAALGALVGEYVWWVRKGADDVLSLEFGSPRLVIREPMKLGRESSQIVIDALGRRIVEPIGKWHLFVDDGEWSIVTKSYGTRRFDTDGARAAATFRQLDGQKLVRAHYLDRIGTWHLVFDLGGSLAIGKALPERFDWDKESQWVLFYEDGHYLSVPNDLRLGLQQ